MGPIPAFSRPFVADRVQPVTGALPSAAVSREWAIAGGTGRGVRVAIIDSGVDASHPDVGPIQGYASLEVEGDDLRIDTAPHEDLFGHGTACAGIVRKMAPEAEIVSVRVLGSNLSGSFPVVLKGLQWALENGANVCNLSCGTTRHDFALMLHEVADKAYFGSAILVVAANNLPTPSYPAMFSSVVSVASHDSDDCERLLCNARPPVEFGAPGVEVDVAWLGHARKIATGNSYAAPHVTGHVARMLSRHPGLHPSEVKAILRAISANRIDS